MDITLRDRFSGQVMLRALQAHKKTTEKKIAQAKKAGDLEAVEGWEDELFGINDLIEKVEPFVR